MGGCVRDLLLRRVPKDFDVITTAGLTQVICGNCVISCSFVFFFPSSTESEINLFKTDSVDSIYHMQIHKLFCRSRIVGRRFPICMVHIRGSITEVVRHFHWTT